MTSAFCTSVQNVKIKNDEKDLNVTQKSKKMKNKEQLHCMVRSACVPQQIIFNQAHVRTHKKPQKTCRKQLRLCMRKHHHGDLPKTTRYIY